MKMLFRCLLIRTKHLWARVVSEEEFGYIKGGKA